METLLMPDADTDPAQALATRGEAIVDEFHLIVGGTDRAVPPDPGPGTPPEPSPGPSPDKEPRKPQPSDD